MYGGSGRMLAVNFTNMRENFKTYCDKVNDDYETIIITRKDNKNVVMISQDEYNNIMENLYIMSNKKYYDRLVESRKQIERGEMVKKSTEELEEMTDE